MALEFLNEQEDGQKDTTPTFAQVLKTMRDAIFSGLCVSMPAEVVSIKNYRKKQVIDVKPYFKKRYSDGQEFDPPLIHNVPVKLYRAGGAWISMPLKVGHSVSLEFSDRSLEKWLTSGARQHPDDTRMHHISDAVAYPGLYPLSDALSLPNITDVIIANENLIMKIKPNGHIQISNQTDELLKVLNDMLQIIREAKVATGSNGLQPLIHHKFSTVASRLKTFLEK